MYRLKIEKPTVAALSTSSTGYSDVFDGRTSFGAKMAVLLKSSGGSVAVSQQCSMDGVTFYDPKTTGNAATGTLCTGITGATAGTYFEFTPVQAPYFRWKIIEGGTGVTTVTIVHSRQE